MLEKMKNMFKGKGKEESAPENKEKTKATKNKEPWVSVLTTHVDKTNPKNGFFEIPNGIGLGFDPDKNVLKDYRVN